MFCRKLCAIYIFSIHLNNKHWAFSVLKGQRQISNEYWSLSLEDIYFHSKSANVLLWCATTNVWWHLDDELVKNHIGFQNMLNITFFKEKRLRFLKQSGHRFTSIQLTFYLKSEVIMKSIKFFDDYLKSKVMEIIKDLIFVRSN